MQCSEPMLMKEFCQSASEPFCSDYAHTLVSQKAQRPTKLKKTPNRPQVIRCGSDSA
jgi:hypothetical protein